VRAQWDGLLGAYPELGDGTPTAPQSVGPDELAAQACAWVASGARIVGGCCGTTPEHIRALAARAASYGGDGISPTSFGT
jgi:S-methylmethionine-dependent homocysteine/selenocysteine methylase